MRPVATVKMTSRSKGDTTPETLDPQITAALSVLGDARQLVRDAARWRALEPHMLGRTYPADAAKGTGPYSVLMVGTTVLVQGATAETPGAVLDAYIAARKLAARIGGDDATR
jgi:hypothetical protein